ncbi:MAG: sensor histidine kinase [Acetatifactor sp.]
MKKLRSFGNIQKRILFVTLSCILAMCLIISYASYYIFQNYLQQSMMQSTETNLRFLSDTICGNMGEVYRMAQFCQNNSNIARYIKNNPNPGSVLAVNTYDRMLEEYNSNTAKTYMPRVTVITNEHFLQICTNSTYSTTANLADEVPGLPFFDTLLDDSDYNFSIGIIPDPFLRSYRPVLPIIRPITYQYNSIQGGYLFIEVSADLFTDALRGYAHAEDSCIYLTLDGNNYLMEQNLLTKIETAYEIREDLSGTAQAPDILIHEVSVSDGTRRIIISAPLNMSGCYISQSISISELQGQRILFLRIIIAALVGIMAVGVLLMMLMNRMIHTPVARLRDKIQRVSQGDFSREPSIEWNHELGDIGRGINDLSESVTQLMNRRIEDEKQKQDLEYQMLQSQINPHFIYNTLNSIKWMATIQGAGGIAEMTTALSRLLKSIAKGTQLLIPIREELDFLEDYFTIQNYRYGGTITFALQVEDPAIYDCKILRFTLQPFVENSIFHGIEPRGGAGHITVHACYESGAGGRRDIRIDITDDGVGIPPDKAYRILEDGSDSRADFFREIGISNVHKRLQYEFGDSYGVTVESVVGEYTTMSIHIPGPADRQEGQDLS